VKSDEGMRHILAFLLDRYEPTDLDEKISKQRMLVFMKEYENCFERSLAIGHFTSSAWLLNCDGTHVLLMHHAKLDKWLQLGGHCDGNSDVLAVAIKEAQEESGIENIVPVSENIFDIGVHEIPARGNCPTHDHYDVRFLLQVVGDGSIVQNRESKELRWFGKNLNELPNQDRSVVRMFEKWINW